MKVSMDGLRKNMGNALEGLEVQLGYLFDVLDMEDCNQEVQDVKDAFDRLSGSIGAAYCVYDPEQENFRDMSEDAEGLPTYWEDEEN